ncbi:multiple C2 and transmembrane domain-containing protein-like isoform X3 [Eriocheir sinensis]|uniref:multiple C2 and transmembrane domain-containing protein-like isoform X3 n=1 Tax=Eriocheir sinensis TaxID=95602 RepID=UPI0021C61C66|nr:multiple C2 and transmembrane domain-containing protein-like isoform X3 [Eriocheir sinensis]
MSEGVAPQPPSDTLPRDPSDYHLDAFHITVSEPLTSHSRRDQPLTDCRSDSPVTRAKRGLVGVSIARAFRKVFRSRTPSPSTDEREEEREEEPNSEPEDAKLETSSDSECQHADSCEPQPEVKGLPVLSALNNNSVLSSPTEDVSSPIMKDFLSPHTPVLGKSQTYSALSEALHHAFLEGMICSGAEDISILSCDDLQSQSSKSDNDYALTKSIDYSLNNKKSASCVLTEVRESLKKTLEHRPSIAVPSASTKPGTFPEACDAPTDDDSSSYHSQEDKHESHTSQDHEPKSLLGNLFSSRRPSLAPHAEDAKHEEAGAPQASPRLKLKESFAHEHKGHKKLGDKLSKVAGYLQRGGSRLAEQQRRLKSQIWSSVVTIVLVEGKNLLPMDADGTSDPYVKFRLGNEKYKSKADFHTLHPKWLEQFDFHQFDEQSSNLEITVWDKDVRTKDDFMGRCVLDISKYEKEKTHHIWAPLDKGAGSVFLLLTISGITSSETISDLHSFDDNPKELQNMAANYKWTRTLHNVKDVGHLRVKVFRAQGLASADIGGKSDPFCVLELVNDRLQTQTEYKTLSPSWNKVFNFNVKDIHSILEVTVYDEDRDHKVEFLGKIAIPLLKIRNGEKKWHALKDKKLRMRAKGLNPEILLECTIYWNPLRAAVRTFMPKEEKFMQVEQKFKRQVFITNVNRLKACIMDFIEGGKFIKSCFEWEYPIRSTFAFIAFMVGTYCFEPYMIPIILLIVYLKNYIVLAIVGTMYHREEDTDISVDDDEVDDDEKDKEEKKSLKERLQAIQEVTATVQNAIGAIASLFESVNNTFNFSVPFLSWLLIIVLFVGTFVLYYIPIRYLVMLWGVNKFTRKLIRPHAVINNELLDFLSRVPDDETLRDCRELRMVAQLHDDKRRDNRKKKQS